MTPQAIGIVHPGDMGISLAVCAQKSGHPVYWAADGRSAQTRERAARYGLTDMGNLAALCAGCAVIISICPPHAAETIAQEVVAHGFTGLYLDANAIAPQRAVMMSEAMTAQGATFVDGGIIGGPAWKPGTRLYLSGPRAAEVAACFAAGPLETIILGEQVGSASALKMCFAAYSKGSTALLAAILATAERLEVRQPLYDEWSRDDSAFAEQVNQRVRRATAKAWRFEGEMDEIAATFQGAGLPGDFHTAAAQIYRRLAGFKDAPVTPPLEAVLAALLQTEPAPE